MKKYSILKILGITFLIVVALSWIIPIGSFSEGNFALGKTDPLGLLDIIRVPLSTFANFVHYGITFLIIGGLYGVLIKTGAYDNLVESVVAKFNKKEKTFLIITMLIFTILTSLTGLVYPILVMVPFFMTVLLLMNYNKLTTLMATIGSMFVGLIGCTYGFGINGIINYYFALDTHNEVITKFIFLTLITCLLIFFVLKTSKKVKVENTEKIDIPLFKKDKKNQKSYWPLAIVMIITLIFLFIGMYNWIYSFNITFFTEIHNNIMDLKVADYPLVGNLIGAVNAMGYWSIYDLVIILIVAILLIGWIYSIKFKDLIDSFISGAKEMFPTACYVTLANLVLMVILSTSNQNMFYTIANHFFELAEKLNVITMSIVSAIGSFFYNDFSSYFSAMGTNIAIVYPDAELYPVIALIIRTMYGLVMFVAPTSLLLIGGLSYLNISYKEWLKYIWKYLVQLFIIALLVMVIMLIFI